LNDRLAVVKAVMVARAAGTSGLSAASENGKSFEFRGTDGLSIRQEIDEIRQALSYVDDDIYAAPAQTSYRAYPWFARG